MAMDEVPLPLNPAEWICKGSRGRRSLLALPYGTELSTEFYGLLSA